MTLKRFAMCLTLLLFMFSGSITYETSTKAESITPQKTLDINKVPMATKKPVKSKKPEVIFSYISLLHGKMLKTHIEENSIGTPELFVVITNNTNKDVIAIQFSCSFIDAFGDTVYKLGTKEKKFVGRIQNIRVPKKGTPSTYDDPKKKTGVTINNARQYSFNLALYELATEIYNSKPDAVVGTSIELEMVKFSDGTIWKKS